MCGVGKGVINMREYTQPGRIAFLRVYRPRRIVTKVLEDKWYILERKCGITFQRREDD